MMDFSISLVTPEMNRQRGADAFDRGVGIDEHHMNPGSPAIADWKKGWMERQGQVVAGALLGMAMVMEMP